MTTCHSSRASNSLAAETFHDRPLDSTQFRRAMSKFGTGVTVISYDTDEGAVGMTANAFLSLSVNPPMILVSIRKESRFATLLSAESRFGVSFLSAEQQAISQHFGGKPNPEQGNPFGYLNQVPVINDALVSIQATVSNVYEGGDHLIYTAYVEKLEEKDGAPLLYFGGQYTTV